MGNFVYISDIDINETDEHLVFLNHKTIGLSTDSKDFQIFIQIVKEKMPRDFLEIGIESFFLTKEDIRQLEVMLKNTLEKLIANKKQYPRGAAGDFKEILGKNVQIHLKNPEDKIISSLAKILEIAQGCLIDNKNLYLSIMERRA